MFNNRKLAITAMLALMLPALGAAATAYDYSGAGPVQETLVEGHTVFTVIQVRATPDDPVICPPEGDPDYDPACVPCDPCPENQLTARFAAAVAVLVREDWSAYDGYVPGEGAPGYGYYQASRFPGVLWFNDQYLVNPEGSSQFRVTNQTFQSDYTNGQALYRYPCGGAIIAVNEGDPDPRTSFTHLNGAAGSDRYSNGAYPNDYAIIGASVTGGVWTDAATGVLSYNTSYFVTDPNDHSWVIDRYWGQTRIGTSGPDLATSYGHHIWVVNMMGSPIFQPDVTTGQPNCLPFRDLWVAGDLRVPEQIGTMNVPYNNLLRPYQDGNGAGAGECPAWTPGHANQSYSNRCYQDDPSAGYQEPANGYCYNGNPDGDPVACSTTAGTPTEPVRLYNGLLYFELQHLTIPQDPRLHDGTSTDTNGCQVDTEWQCPDDDDNKEGNSHPFNPETGPYPTAANGMCPAGFTQTDGQTTNHGGSTTSGTASACDHTHATRSIDIYYSGKWRPQEPVLRSWAVYDVQGSDAPFHQH